MKEEIKQLIKKRKQLELSIYELAIRFKNETGLCVSGIEVSLQSYPSSETVLTDVRVKLDF